MPKRSSEQPGGPTKKTKFPCDQCSTSFTQQWGLNAHVADYHKQELLLDCEVKTEVMVSRDPHDALFHCNAPGCKHIKMNDRCRFFSHGSGI
ncbi:hypothetical protein B0O80DRAFT_457046 [Mortierella sp. GBAus27b]|nr:hypothetical protein B0O80DRAFT_457046 [Mortierella sp. GBAus27b]